MRFVLIGSLMFACRSESKPVVSESLDTGRAAIDFDGDGYPSDEDCDDNNSTVNAGAIEVCDGVDNNCDGEIDEGVTTTYYLDTDGDGFGEETNPVEACAPPDGHVPFASDCNDGDSTVYPGAPELCDSLDNDCDELIDEELVSDWYIDSDGDGYGDPQTLIESCAPGSGYVNNDSDCNDEEPAAYAGAEEICDGIDNDCDGTIDNGFEQAWYLDADNDGYGDSATSYVGCLPPSGFVNNDLDCDDINSGINPDGVEQCNDFVDNDCDGVIDEPDAIDSLLWYADGDSDGYGDPNQSQYACYQPNGHVSDGSDCDDSQASSNPGATEVCDGLDNDCNGSIDDSATDALMWYQDSDTDGFGDSSAVVSDCSQPSGYVSNSTDCDPSNGAIFPGADEYCNGIDDNCDGSIDENSAVDGLLWYADGDSDGFGDLSSSVSACAQPSGYVSDSSDCDPNDGAIYPGADEYCNGIDDNCDGSIDEDSAVDGLLWYADSDSDGFGDSSSSVSACAQPSGHVSDSTDCDPSNGAIYPGADEYCNGIDDNCDGDVDESLAVDALSWYADVDLDGYGDANVSVLACAQPSGYVSDNIDCDDSLGLVFPGADELCNGLDDNCDGAIDESTALDAQLWYADGDTDGYGDLNSSLYSCTQPNGHVSDSSDCDDLDLNINPAALEICDGVDNNCNGLTDAQDPNVNGLVLYYEDLDGDGYGDSSSTVLACGAPSSGYVDVGGDCDDLSSDTNPDAAEVWDCEDRDCDGFVLPVGDGRDGPLSVSGNQTFTSVTHAVSGPLSAGTNTATLSSTSGLSSGDYVLIINMHGGSAGDYDLLAVDSVNGSALTFRSYLQYDYPSSDTVMAVRVPQYSSVSLSGQLFPAAWNGSSGGIIAFMVSGATSLNGTIHANGLGYRGGSRTYSATQTGQQGESYNGTQTRTTSANYSAGGGGYSPSLTHSSGGGGGHATSGTTGNAYGGYGNIPGAGGGTKGDSELTSLFFGGAGGSGGLDVDPGGGSYGGAGGAGGGMVLLSMANLNVSGNIQANGANGESGYYTGSASPGGGGGGAGGSIFIGAQSIVGTANLSAQGGVGGNGSEAGGGPLPAGNGGNGRIVELLPNAVNASPSAQSTCL